MNPRPNEESERDALENLPVGAFVFRQSGGRMQCTSANSCYAEMLGLTAGELTGEAEAAALARVHPDDRMRCRRELLTRLAETGTASGTYRLWNRGAQQYRWFRLDSRMAQRPDGGRAAYFTCADMSDTAQLREAQERSRQTVSAIVRYAPGGVFVYSAEEDEQFSFVSENMLAMLGYTLEEFRRKFDNRFSHMVYEADRQATLDTIWEQIAAGPFDTCYYRIEKKDGSLIWVHDEGHIVTDESGKRWFYVVIVDITASERAKEENFNRVIQELLVTNPNALCTFRLNLTQNRCSDGHGTSEYIRQLLTADTVDELIRKVAAVIIGPQEAESFIQNFGRSAMLRQFSEGRDRLEMSYRRRTDTGGAHWVTTYFHILQNPYTGDVEAIAYSVDADHAHKEAEIVSIITSEEYDCIGLVDAATHGITYYYMSEAYAASGGKNPRSFEERAQFVSGQLLSETERQNYLQAASFEAVCRALESRQTYSYSYSGEKWRKQVIFRYLDDSRTEILFTITDVTKSFEHEEAHARQLRKALLDAEKANDMKTDFLGNVSHDMRTPLNAILGYNRLAMDEPDVPPQVMDYLQKTETAGNTLLTLINDTLDLQRIETGTVTLKPEPVSCGAVIQDIITSVQPLMEEKHLDFAIDTSRAVMATIRVDLMRVREIFINLLSNAVKFTPEGGRVELIVECVRLEPERVYDRILVRDTGVGMSPEFMEKMYEPFTQERTRDTAHIGGSGLGLSIVRRTVELMGGRIEAKSERGRGTEFTVYLDFERLDDKPVSGAPSQETDIRGMHVLLCEDNAMNAEIAGRILEMNGATYASAADGQAGVRAFAAAPPGTFDAILMDIRMPVMDGYAAAQAIRRSGLPDADTVPILAMSADAYDSDVEKALRSGMNGHISKPVDPRRMVAELARLAGRGKTS